MKTWKHLEPGSSSHAETALTWPLGQLRKQKPPVCPAGAQGISQGVLDFTVAHQDLTMSPSSMPCCHLSRAHFHRVPSPSCKAAAAPQLPVGRPGWCWRAAEQPLGMCWTVLVPAWHSAGLQGPCCCLWLMLSQRLVFLGCSSLGWAVVGIRDGLGCPGPGDGDVGSCPTVSLFGSSFPFWFP